MSRSFIYLPFVIGIAASCNPGNDIATTSSQQASAHQGQDSLAATELDGSSDGAIAVESPTVVNDSEPASGDVESPVVMNSNPPPAGQRDIIVQFNFAGGNVSCPVKNPDGSFPKLNAILRLVSPQPMTIVSLPPGAKAISENASTPNVGKAIDISPFMGASGETNCSNLQSYARAIRVSGKGIVNVRAKLQRFDPATQGQYRYVLDQDVKAVMSTDTVKTLVFNVGTPNLNFGDQGVATLSLSNPRDERNEIDAIAIDTKGNLLIGSHYKPKYGGSDRNGVNLMNRNGENISIGGVQTYPKDLGDNAVEWDNNPIETILPTSQPLVFNILFRGNGQTRLNISRTATPEIKALNRTSTRLTFPGERFLAESIECSEVQRQCLDGCSIVKNCLQSNPWPFFSAGLWGMPTKEYTLSKSSQGNYFSAVISGDLYEHQLRVHKFLGANQLSRDSNYGGISGMRIFPLPSSLGLNSIRADLVDLVDEQENLYLAYRSRILKLNPSGQDAAWGTDSRGFIDLPADIYGSPRQMLLDGRGRLLVLIGGYVLRFTDKGELDASFGQGGKFRIEGVGFHRMTLTPDYNLFVGGIRAGSTNYVSYGGETTLRHIEDIYYIIRLNEAGQAY